MNEKKIKKSSYRDAGSPPSLVLLPTRPQEWLTAVYVSRCFVGERINGRWYTSVLLAACLLLALSYSATSNAGTPTDQQQYSIDVPQLNAAQALNRLAEQTGVTFLFPYEVAEAQQANPVVGRFTLMEALSLLLKDSGLTGGLTDSGVVIISRKDKSKNGEGMGMHSKKKLLASTIAFFVGSGVASIGVAQEQEAGTGEPKFMLEEIVVTATKRETSLQDTVGSIAAISAEGISRKGIVVMDDYLRKMPGVSYVGRGEGKNAVVVRGISSDPQGEVNRSGPSVGVYFGEISLTGLGQFGGTSDVRMVDLERVEVLRGPQGTLFGASSLSGTVRNVPNAPNMNEVEGRIEAEYSNTSNTGGDNTNFEGVLNIPLVEDMLALRAVAYRRELSGFVNNAANSHPAYSTVPINTYGAAESLFKDEGESGASVTEGARLSLRWKPTDELSATLLYIDQEVEQDGLPGALFVDEFASDFEQTRMQIGSVTSGGISGGNKGGFKSEGFLDEVEITNLVVDYDFGWATLLSSSSWVDGYSVNARSLTALVGGVPLVQFMEWGTEAFQQEIRLVSSLDGPLQFVVGYYYEDIETNYDQFIHYVGDFDEVPGFVGQPFANTTLIDYIFVDEEHEQKSFFADITYSLTDQFDVSVGARRYEFDRWTDKAGLAGGFVTGLVDDTSSFDESGTNYRVNLSYAPNDETLLYAQWAEGFRLGATQVASPASVCDVDNDGILDGTDQPIRDSFDSDSLDSYELGVKTAVLDDRLQINAAIYRIDWVDIPVDVASPAPGCFGTTIANAGEAVSQGVELETVFAATSQLTVEFGASYVDATLDKDEPNLNAESGDRLPGSPRFNASLGLEYEFILAGNDSYLRSDYAYVGNFYNNITHDVEVGGYSQLDLSAGVAIDSYNFELFARNVTDADDLTWVNSNAFDRAYRLRPRTIGLKVNYIF